ncbi:hypothetical protein BRADI_1g45551v3 [Brachypodium distachyon]|nr:hypothetical protein BRADI_1g45551v3 [Brachypodium distachyon]
MAPAGGSMAGGGGSLGVREREGVDWATGGLGLGVGGGRRRQIGGAGGRIGGGRRRLDLSRREERTNKRSSGGNLDWAGLNAAVDPNAGVPHCRKGADAKPGAAVGAMAPNRVTPEARCCAWALAPANANARPDRSYSARLATRAASSRSSHASAAHLASLAAAGDRRSASCRLSSILAASPWSPRSAAARAAAMSSAASTRNRSTSTSFDGSSSSASAGRRTTASPPATSIDLPVAASLYPRGDVTLLVVVSGAGGWHVEEYQEAALLVGVELSDVHLRGAAVRHDAARVPPGLDGPDARAGAVRRARDGEPRLLRRHREDPSDALRERVLNHRLVLDEGERAARGGLGDRVHRRRVVVGAEAERVDRRARGPAAVASARHEVAVVTAGEGVLAVGEKDDGGDRVPVPPSVEHLGGNREPVADVRAATGLQRLDGELGGGPAGVRHAGQVEDAAGGVGEGDDAEAVGGAELVHDEPHGALHQRQLVPLHAPADVQHRHEIHRRASPASGGRRSLGVHQHGEVVDGLAPGHGRALAVHLERHERRGRIVPAVDRRRLGVRGLLVVIEAKYRSERLQWRVAEEAGGRRQPPCEWGCSRRCAGGGEAKGFFGAAEQTEQSAPIVTCTYLRLQSSIDAAAACFQATPQTTADLPLLSGTPTVLASCRQQTLSVTAPSAPPSTAPTPPSSTADDDTALPRGRHRLRPPRVRRHPPPRTPLSVAAAAVLPHHFLQLPPPKHGFGLLSLVFLLLILHNPKR